MSGTRAESRPIAAAALISLALVWLGLLLGVSFLATPAKFLAPSLSLAVALDVGRHTFAVFSLVEAVAGTALLALAFVNRQRLRVPVLAVGIIVIVAAQALWLLPALDARVTVIAQGGMPEPSVLHSVYVALEALKAAALIALAHAGFRLYTAPGRER